MPRENLCGKCRGRSLAKLGGLPWSSEIGGESSCLTERIRRLKSLALDDLSVDESDVGDPSPSPAGQATISIRSSPQRDLSSTGSIKKGRAVYWESAETERSEATPKSESASSSRYQRPSCESEHPSEASVPEGPSASCPDTDAVRQPTELNNSRRILSPINVSKTPMMGAKEEAHDNAAFPARHVPAEDQKVKSINEAQLASPRSGDNCKSDMQQLGGLAASAIGNLRYHDTIDELLSGTAASLEADLIATGSRMHGHPNPRHTYRDPAAVSTGSPPERHEISKIANPSAAASITAHPQVDAGTPYIEQLGHSSPLNFNDLCPDPSYYDDNSSLPRYAPARKSVRFQDQDGGESFDLGVACTTDSEYWTRDYNAFLPSSSIRSFTTPTHPDIKVPDFQHGRHSDQRYPYSTADYHQARRDALHSQCCDQSCYPESAFWNVGRGYDYVNGNAQDCTTSPSSLDHMNPRATTPPGASSPFDFDKWSEISHPEDDEFYSHVPDEAEHKWINDCAKIYMAYSMDDTSPTSPGVHHNVPPASRTLYDDLEEFDEKLRAVRSCFRPCDDDDVVSQHDNDAPAGHGYNSPRLGLKRASSSEGDTSLSRAGPKLFPVSASLVVYTGHDSTDDEDDELI
ncbi:hypothetical protein NKR23_g10440 [Pleurostoma richardsiae]|uniref:Uncharacterized protein n=1 Tax=Pleurostoma richardsiae TaxID=41990 RepID=A0AA38VLM0_9PEZI|nr:hypothetical protein NKR23_g10440 [Pleurostoma richardsiae]